MATVRSPHKGGIQFWPRKRAKRVYARIRTFPKSSTAKLLGFAGYKAGMIHLTMIDNRTHSMTKGEEISVPVTIIECPPIKPLSLRFYQKTSYGLRVAHEFFSPVVDKELARKAGHSKNTTIPEDITVKLNEYADITVVVHTMPGKTGIGKKKPEVFELGLGGKSIEEKFNYGKGILGKEISVRDVFKEGQLVDAHAVSRGHGLQGPVKRFGVTLRSHKSEKTIRGPGTLGPWHPHMVSIKVAHAGQMGFHQRIEYNKWLLKISDKVEKVNPKGGFAHYGVLKNTFMILKGSIPGTQKRLIRFSEPRRKYAHVPEQPPEIQHIVTT